MGIPSYFRNVVGRFPSTIKSTSSKCHRLYLDYNGVVHQCAATVAKQNVGLSRELLHEKVINAAIDYIDKICETCQPQELLYISVDGVCPRAKMSQQRKRRYMSVWQKQQVEKERERLNMEPSDDTWNSNIVTPGTPFMKDLDVKLLEYAHNRSTDTLKVVCSPSSESGEGEHKIVQHIRRGTSESDAVIYGLDADLILLSLIVSDGGNGPRMRLLRERPEFNVSGIHEDAQFCMLHISELEKGISEIFCPGAPSMSLRDKTRDLVMLTSLVGNDFLPPLSFLKIKENGLDYLMDSYVYAREACGHAMRLVADDGSCNWMFLDAILKHLLKKEDANFAASNEAYYKRRPSAFGPKDPNDPLWQKKFELDNYSVLNKFRGKIDSTRPGWHTDYYAQLFSSPDAMSPACKKYIDGLEWNFEYYLHGDQAPNSRWYYPFLYSPTIKDLCNFVSLRICDQGYESTAFDPFEYNSDMQLLMVLPPESINEFLPKHAIVTSDPEMGCMDMYPTDFKIMTYLKHQLWECIPVLPPIDEDRLKKYIHTNVIT